MTKCPIDREEGCPSCKYVKEELCDYPNAIGKSASQHSEVIQKLLQEVWDASAKVERKRFKQRVEGLEVIGDEERLKVNIPCETCDSEPNWGGILTMECLDCMAKCHIEAQLQADKQTLLKLCV